MKKTNIFGLVLILSTLLIGCAQPNMCADIPEVYTITCGPNVTVSKTQAMAGEMITVEATPGTNQRVASIKQNDVNLTVTADNKATFEMPAGNVNVTAVFDTKHTITLSDTTNMKFPNMEGSTIMAFAGETINVEYRDGFTGYEVALPTLTTGGAITPVDTTGYSFVMPNSDVTFNTTFVDGDTQVALYISTGNGTARIVDQTSGNPISHISELNFGDFIKYSSLKSFTFHVIPTVPTLDPNGSPYRPKNANGLVYNINGLTINLEEVSSNN